MFELPEAKRVRREDLNKEDDSSCSDSGDEGLDSDLQARLNAQVAKSLGMDIDDPAPATSNSRSKLRVSPQNPAKAIKDVSREEEARVNANDEQGEFEFRLFSTAGAPSKVVLENDAGLLGEGALACRRPLSYYLAQNASENKRREYLAAAVTGEDVVERSHRPSWGMQLPWKVTRVIITRKAKLEEGEKMEGVVTGEEGTKTRKRLGKKRRIAVRIKINARKEMAEAEAKKALGKEEQLKEKKKRLNRLKKLRKRAKKKAGKAEQDQDGEDDESRDESAGE